MKFPDICVVDTNVPVNANKAREETPDVPFELIRTCVEAIRHVINNNALVIDVTGEIFAEYRHRLKLSGEPGVGDKFVKWVNDNQWTLPEDHRVTISPDGESYREFPVHEGLSSFDPSDRKFIAVANAHPLKPPILQATDSKWVAWEAALKAVGIDVVFLDREYVEEKQKNKMKQPKLLFPQ